MIKNVFKKKDCITYPRSVPAQASGEGAPKLESHQLDRCLQWYFRFMLCFEELWSLFPFGLALCC